MTNKPGGRLRISFLATLVFLLTFAATSQTQWLVVEETSLVGSISGTVQQGRIFRTASGSIYEVTGVTLQLVMELSPDVLVLRSGDVYKLIVEGFDEPLICRRLKPGQRASQSSANDAERAMVVESHIAGDFEGWDGETIFKLDNGQIWQQATYAYMYRYAYRPEVTIFQSRNGYKMKVEGVDETIGVIRLK